MSAPNSPYKYGLAFVELNEAHIQAIPTQGGSIPGFNFTIKVENGVDPEKSYVLSRVTVHVMPQKSETILGKLTATIGYSVSDFATVAKKDEQGQVNVPAELLATLNGIAISTTRGILFGVLKGTPLHGAYLPLVDVKNMAPELPLEGK